uniref:Uncharacterized protein n=1 Tax=Xenopus tropicalis TaxID=8364 RepID=A0A1B8Y0F6_XENTR
MVHQLIRLPNPRTPMIDTGQDRPARIRNIFVAVALYRILGTGGGQNFTAPENPFCPESVARDASDGAPPRNVISTEPFCTPRPGRPLSRPGSYPGRWGGHFPYCVVCFAKPAINGFYFGVLPRGGGGGGVGGSERGASSECSLQL